jgi:hypothetical protein
VNKENIFEELNKMRNLMNAKSGTVISEQVENLIVKTLYNSVAGPGTNPEKFRDAIFALKNAQEFSSINSELQKFRNSRLDIAGWINDDFDNTNLDDIKKISDHLKSIGINNSYEEYPGRGGFKQGTFKILTTPPAAQVANTDEAWKTTYSCVTTQPGAKAVKTKNAGLAYLVGQIYYYANGRKMLADGSMASYSCATEFKSGTANSGGGSGSGSRTGGGSRQDVNSRFSKSAESLGIQSGKMDLQTLQSILKTLEGGQSTPAVAATATQGTPDLAQLTAALNQLNA